MGSLPAALISVPSSVELTTAKTTMVRHKYSQLAVIDGHDGTCHGAVTWESIGRAHIATDHPTLADATVPAMVVDHDAPLLDQIEQIYDHGFIFYAGSGSGAGERDSHHGRPDAPIRHAGKAVRAHRGG
ncbi:CBS domain-containing protein [Nocardia sp. NPDC087230]|uniref:CBS domain-containing protein n=1 Tax=Nocardia sp. NPDC087230 TaxID=3364331 RepID=UPI003823F254